MGITDRPLRGLIQKIRSWITTAVSVRSSMPLDCAVAVCFECSAATPSVPGHQCCSCGRLFCRNCMHSRTAGQPTFCRFCYRAIVGHAEAKPGNKLHHNSSPPALHCSTCRNLEEEDAEEGGRHYFSPMSEASQDNNSDTDTVSVSTGHEFYSFKSSPLDSPGRASDQGGGNSPVLDQDSPGYLRRIRADSEDLLENISVRTYGNLAAYDNSSASPKAHPPLDFENNSLIWYPPPPENEEDDVEAWLFGYDDEDDNGSESTAVFSSASFSSEGFQVKEKPNDANREHLRSTVNGHFRALVAQLLKGEGLRVDDENGRKGWLEIISSLSWQAATFVKPDTSKGGSMDPGDYVKVKCISSGIPSDSMLIKGVVCTKNIKHKHMVSQHKNPRLLILGGALEYQRVPNKLASINTVLEQEIDHLKMVVSKIEACRPNVLLVEKTVSSYAQEYLLAKEISLVLNVKRPLLDRISRCTGAKIAPSIDNLASGSLGQCEMFRIVKVAEECSSTSSSKNSVKTLMFFEGCPRRLGCTVLLKGACLEELKKVKHVIRYASFAAYHLSLETSFLVDEGASLPKIPLKDPVIIPERLTSGNMCISTSTSSATPYMHQASTYERQKVASCSKFAINCSSRNEKILGISTEQKELQYSFENTISGDSSHLFQLDSQNGDCIIRSTRNLSLDCFGSSASEFQCKDTGDTSQYQTGARICKGEILENSLANSGHLIAADEQKVNDMDDTNGIPLQYFSTLDNHQSILVSFSSNCILKGAVCERSQLFRIKFYGSSDKPLGRYLRDDLFDRLSCCPSCKEPAEAHVRCYIHQQGSLTISVRRLPSMRLPGERDGRIWMWHRCLKCEHKNGVPPAAQRVVMSDAAWGLSFGKFLELSFSNHTTANRIASCGHSLQRDCLRFFGFGNTVAFFRYSPLDILSIHLPSLVLDFTCSVQQEWVRKEEAVISGQLEFLHEEVSNVLYDTEERITTSEYGPLKTSIHKYISDLRDLLRRERYEYDVLLQPAASENAQLSRASVDILELNRLRRCLLIDSYTWDRRLHLLDSLSKGKNSTSVVHLKLPDILTHSKLKEWKDEAFCKDGNLGSIPDETMMQLSTMSRTSRKSLLSKQHAETSLQVLECNSNSLVEMDLSIESVDGYVGSAALNLVSGQCYTWDQKQLGAEHCNDTSFLEGVKTPEESLSDKIDLLWTGTSGTPSSSTSNAESDSVGSLSPMDNPHCRKLISPVRVYSFDSALRFQNKISRGLSPSSPHLSTLKSFDVSGDFGKDSLQNMGQAYTQKCLRASRSLNFVPNQKPAFIISTSSMVTEGARFLQPQPGLDNIVVLVYDNDPTSIIPYAISSQEHANFIAGKSDQYEVSSENKKGSSIGHQVAYCTGPSTLAPCESSSRLHDDVQSECHGSEEPRNLRESVNLDPKESHFRISFEDDSSFSSDRVKFSVICFFARQFDALRKKCCPNEIDFIRSLSRCKRWKADGGKSNVYFAKSLDERFIIKQVSKTELDSFEEFAPEYFKHLTESINYGSPTSLAKVLGIYQVNIKHLKGGREVKMDLMVMENLFFQRKISRVYDLKGGSSRARYNPDTSGNKVLLDLNLLETLRTKPIFLGSKAKRTLERAVWNDTSFLASIDVMDYSLLVGVDEEKKELVIGIIDFMRQYTWDKHLETWVKASGILGGPKNASPTVISPKQYKKRFRKAMSSYFLAVPDHWSS